MIETADFHDPLHGIPVFSLYGQVRRPTDAMMQTPSTWSWSICRTLGTRIYTFVTTLRYMLEAAAAHGKAGLGAGPPPPPSAGPSRAFACGPAGKAASAPVLCRGATA